jgi:diphthamide biosynthesis methyltransferase
MEISKGARRGTHLNSLKRYYICCRVKENKHIQLHTAMHLQWIHSQQIIFQSNMHMYQSQNTQLKQKQLKHKMACTKNRATTVQVLHGTQF